MADYWKKENQCPRTYGDITEAFKTRQTIAAAYREDEPVREGVSVWLKLGLAVSLLIVLVDKVKF
ncbi:MAG TPA: hypothetical protein VNU93_08225 [Verrucomicrobiae bacterium]|nr:hypothetical protein [Verrucomicrobiae bacterium]